MRFTKMHGLGNDFIVIDNLKGAPDRLDAERARKLCDRHFGIGADQILWLKPVPGFDARMEILNADGTAAEMCGNGVRAIALYLKKHGPKPGLDRYRLETLAGPIALQLVGDQVTVDMGAPRVAEEATLEAQGRSLKYHDVKMGNPHAVIFVDKLDGFPVEELGPVIETLPIFPQGVNVEFVEVTGPHSIRLRVWERGSGLTLACGTGACAAAVAGIHSGRVSGKLRVGLPGGELSIEWPGLGKAVMMTGPAVEVFQGDVD